jgi:hypothetical protein
MTESLADPSRGAGTSVNDAVRYVGADPANSPQAAAEGRALAVVQGGSYAYIARPAEERDD